MKRADLEVGKEYGFKQGTRYGSVERVFVVDTAPWEAVKSFRPNAPWHRQVKQGHGVAIARRARYGKSDVETWVPTIAQLSQLVGTFDDAKAREDQQREQQLADRQRKDQYERAQRERVEQIVESMRKLGIENARAHRGHFGEVVIPVDQLEQLVAIAALAPHAMPPAHVLDVEAPTGQPWCTCGSQARVFRGEFICKRTGETIGATTTTEAK